MAIRRPRLLAALCLLPALVCASQAPGQISPQRQTLEAFDYQDAALARRVWQASSGTPAVTVSVEAGRPVVELQAPFATQRELPRAVIDRNVSLNLAGQGGFVLEMAVQQPAAVGHVTLYFRSGGGWFACGQPLSGEGWQELHFPKAAFGTEGRPAGWQQIDGIRISAWRGQALDTQIRLRSLAALRNPVAVVVPDGDEGGELRTARDCAERVSGILGELGLGSDAVTESELAAGALGDRKLAVLAYNPRLSAAAQEVLEEYVEQGGKLLVCYNLPPRLATLLGFARPRYVRQEQPGHFAEIRFVEPRVAGLPKSVRQDSWNITAAEPAAFGARVIGWWFDAAGRPTKQPALLLSGRGAFFSHIVLADDPDGKRQMLAALAGALVPELWTRMAETAIERATRVGALESLDQLSAHLQVAPSAAALSAAADGRRLLAEAQARLAADDAVESLHLAREARQQFVAAYLRAQESPAVEGRAVWNHSGTGAWPGDWERSAQTLAEGGLNMILPNMLWAGRAHYASDVLPRSNTFREYGDQIAQCVEAAHRHGLEVHVWKVNFNLSGAPGDFVARLRAEGRLQRTARGEEYLWLCPSHPENQKLELESMLEVARNYDVDGLHFDYIRYPNGECCYCQGCRRRFEAESGRAVQHWPEDCYRGPRAEEYRQWRCRQITALVEAVSREARKLRPNLRISAAVFGAYPDCRRSVGQDWVSWVRAGYLDFVCPMDYTPSDTRFAGLVENQVKLVGGRVPVYPGVGVTLGRWTLAPERGVGQVGVARRLGAQGFTLFNFDTYVAEQIVPALGLGASSRKASPAHSE